MADFARAKVLGAFKNGCASSLVHILSIVDYKIALIYIIFSIIIVSCAIHLLLREPNSVHKKLTGT